MMQCTENLDTTRIEWRYFHDVIMLLSRYYHVFLKSLKAWWAFGGRVV